jgi:selenide,water dikinase
VLVGLEKADDAGVYRISDNLAIIQTVDFFTPIVDDPYWFGQIAAANALSDVYAMGGEPKTAMNLVAFPIKQMDISILRGILQGSIDKLNEAGVVLIGGHSIEDHELKYGLAVTGFIHPDKIRTKKNLHPGDKLLLTKPLGTGIISTAVKGGIASRETIERTTQMMAKLNQRAARIMSAYDVHACTDITGFGLLGHLAEMVVGSGYSVYLHFGKIPIIPEAFEFASMGFVPEGAFKNREFRQKMVAFSPDINPVAIDILFDPQTSGGLLISVNPDQAEALASELKEKATGDAAIIGEVVSSEGERIIVEQS